MATKEFLGQKLPYMTNPQKKYLEKIQIPLDGYQTEVQKELENLEKVSPCLECYYTYIIY